MIKKQQLFLGISAMVISLVVALGSASASVSSSEVASINATGTQGNDNSFGVSISKNGRYIAFTSSATNLVPNDTNNVLDVFVRDTVSNTIIRVSVASDGTEANEASQFPSISSNGRYVVFASTATNISSTPPAYPTVGTFIHDMQTGTTELVSTNTSGQPANQSAGKAVISGDGRFVAFQSSATNLSGITTTVQNNIYVKDLKTGTTSLISKTGSSEANGYSENPSISCDGGIVAFNSSATNMTTDSNNGAALNMFIAVRAAGDEIDNITPSHGTGDYAYLPEVSCDGNYVAYTSSSANLVAGDTNNKVDVFRYSRPDDTTELVSITSGSAQFNADSMAYSISGDGSIIGFTSSANNTGVSNPSSIAEAYVRNMDTGTTELVSKDSSDNVGNGTSQEPIVSPNGKVVSYSSMATNIIDPSDGNGSLDDVLYANIN